MRALLLGACLAALAAGSGLARTHHVAASTKPVSHATAHYAVHRHEAGCAARPQDRRLRGNSPYADGPPDWRDQRSGGSDDGDEDDPDDAIVPLGSAADNPAMIT
jgi:hypothetical protein